MESQVLKALLLTTIAGLSTTLGGLIGITFKKESSRFMSFILGFTAGIMVGVSFFELFPSGAKEIGFTGAGIAFIIGFIFIFIIDYLVPHEFEGQKDGIGNKTNKKLLRTGLFIALGMAIHNFPEGMATFYSSLVDIKVGIAIAVAIFIHNIPEGIAVSVPIYNATGSKGKAFLWSLFSGIVEPIGAITTALILLPFMNAQILGYILSGIAGLMVFISIDELLPVSKFYDRGHLPVTSFLAGMIIMILSLILIK